MPTWLAVVATAVGAFVGLASFIFSVTEGRSIHRREQRLREALSATNDPVRRRVLEAAHQQAVGRMLARDLTPRLAYWWPPFGLLFIAVMSGTLGWDMVSLELERLAGGDPEQLLYLPDYFIFAAATLGLGMTASLSWRHIRTEQARIAYEYVRREPSILVASTMLEESRRAEAEARRRKAAGIKDPSTEPPTWRELWAQIRPLVLSLVLTLAAAGVGWGVGATLALPTEQPLRMEFFESGGPLPGFMLFGSAFAGTTLIYSLIDFYLSGREFRLPSRLPSRSRVAARPGNARPSRTPPSQRRAVSRLRSGHKRPS